MSATMNEVMKSSTRIIRKVEAPRPLKKLLSETKSNVTPAPLTLSAYSIESVDKLVILLDMVVEAILQSEDTLNDLSSDDASVLTSNIAHLCKHMKVFGPKLENTIYQGQLDRACSVFRDAMVHGSIDYQARVNLLDILELRLNSWKPQRVCERNILRSSNSESENFVGLNDLKNYVKNFSISDPSNMSSERLNRKTSKSQTKSQYKDEIIIRNADSGKVAPTAKERLVQITGASEENISHAARLIGDTIKRNTSPVREMLSESSNSSFTSDESFPEQLGCDEIDSYENGLKNKTKETTKLSSIAKDDTYLYKHKVFLSNCQLTITGEDYTYVTVAKAVLDDYFSKLNGPNCAEEKSPQKSSNMMETCEPPSAKSSLSDYHIPRKIPVSEDADVYNSNLTNNIVGKSNPISLDDLSDDVKKMNAGGGGGNTTESADEVAITYTKEFMLLCRSSMLSQEKPKDWDGIASKFSALVKVSNDVVDIFELDKSDE